MSKEDLKIKPAEQKELEVKPVEQEVKEVDLKDVNGGGHYNPIK